MIRSSDDSTVPRSPRWKPITAIVAVLAVLGGLTVIAYFTPLMSVRSVEVTGTRTVNADEVLRVAQVPQGRPLLRVDTAAIAQRVSTLPAVESVDVGVGYPSTVTVSVVERTPLVTVPRDGRLGVMDRLGMVYLTVADAKALPQALRGLPALKMENPAASNPTTKAALAVIEELPGWLRANVTAVTAESPSGISLTLKSGRTAVWGDAERTGDKAEALRHLLLVKGTEYNVSSPEFASVR